MKKPDFLINKSYLLAVKIVKLVQYIQNEKKEYILSKQLMRSGTAIGALLREAKFAESTADYIHKQSISLKEANETLYWLDLLKDTNYINDEQHKYIFSDTNEMVALLVTSIKKLKSKQPNSKK